MKVLANISLGTAFLSPTEALEDAYRSTLWALEHGADMAILYPMIVKPHTLLDLLYQDNRYRAPSLWALVEVLRRVGPELISRVGISWYKNYSGLPVTEQPTTCELCEADILKRLDDYYATQSWDIVQELSEWPCSCRESWQQSLQESHQETTMPLSERVIESYDYLAEELSLQRYWAKRRDDFLEELLSEVLKSTG
ncbi:hypothetical protein KAI87_05240, partial [Myxococcota bacterium]|nr:hypothetical protein [Myxococcota bacterium]